MELGHPTGQQVAAAGGAAALGAFVQHHGITYHDLRNFYKSAKAMVGGNEGPTTGKKRSRKGHEQATEEPAGHGNTPATGLKQKGYLPRYVPVNFPDKFVVKERYCNTYMVRSAATNAVAAQSGYIIWKTNSNFAVDNSSSGALAYGNHQPNQRDNWAAQYDYYRVEELHYKIHCINTAAASATPTGYTSGINYNDAIVTLLKTTNTGDFKDGPNKWEQKIAHNVVLTSSNGGKINAQHTFEGTIYPEDYDIDVAITAGDETWTAVGSSPAISRYFGISVEPLNPNTVTGALPEVSLNVFIEFMYIVQYAQYKPALREAAS